MRSVIAPKWLACAAVAGLPAACTPPEIVVDAGAADATDSFDAGPPDASGPRPPPPRDLDLPDPPYDLSRFDHFLAAFEALECEQQIYCDDGRGHDALRSEPWWIAPDIQYCHPYYVADRIDRYRAAMEAGRLAYDEAEARRCIAESDPHDCSLFGPIVGIALPCYRALSATTREGDPCLEAGPVGARDACPDGTHCFRYDACPICVDDAVALAEGVPCDILCEYGERCVDDVCMPIGDVGAACEAATQCNSGRCTDGLCVAAPAPGDPCDDANPCGGFGWCDEGICRADTDRDVGDPCFPLEPTPHGSWDVLFDVCPPPLRCAASGCQEPGELGSACDEATRCAFGHRCVDGRCRQVALPGNPCDGESVQCPRGYGCAAGSCVALPLRGERCDADQLPCLEGACVDGYCRYLGDFATCEPSPFHVFPVCSGYTCYGGSCSGVDSCALMPCSRRQACVRDRNGVPACVSACDP